MALSAFFLIFWHISCVFSMFFFSKACHIYLKIIFKFLGVLDSKIFLNTGLMNS